MSKRMKLIGTGILLCLALGLTTCYAIETVQAAQRFEEKRHLTLSGDVSTIRPWMTVPYIARVYHVPESYLYQWLHITNPQSVRRASLQTLADRYNRPVDSLIHEVQKAILTYRQQHPPRLSSTSRNPHAQAPPSPGRKKR